MTPTVTLRTALGDPSLLGTVLEGPSWNAHRVLMIAAMGEALTDDERVVFKQLTGRDHEPGTRVDTLLGVIGRRGGKTKAISVQATYLAGLCDWSDVLTSGETGVLLVIAPDQRQAKITLDYIEAAFRASKMLRKLIVNRTADTLTLSNGISIEVHAANHRRIRGLTCIAVIADEACHYPSGEGLINSDTAILNAVRPSLATTGGMLIIISSPHTKRGEVWEIYKQHYGPDGDLLILVAQGASRVFNPTLPQSIVDRALERDYHSASQEYLAIFADADVATGLTREMIVDCVEPRIQIRAPITGTYYVGFVDTASGSGPDSATFAIGHKENDTVIIDQVIEETPPFSPSVFIEEVARRCKQYRIRNVSGDRYGGELPAEQFRKHGIAFEISAKSKPDLLRDLVALINSKRIVLPDNYRLVGQLVSLERRTTAGGRLSIVKGRGAHDDLANVVAGVASVLSTETAGARYVRAFKAMKIESEPKQFRSPWQAVALVRARES